MAKTETISWRIKPDVRMALEAEARSEGITLAEVLNRMAKQRLEMRKQQSAGDEAEQARLNAAVAKCCGTISGGDPYASEKVRETVRKRVRDRIMRQSRA